MFNYVFAKQIGLINYFLKGPIIRIKKKIICNEIFKFKTITNKEYLIHKWDPSGTEVYLTNCFTDWGNEYLFLDSINKKDKGVFLDIGCHTGYFSCLFNEHFEKIIGFEPSKQCSQALTLIKNIYSNFNYVTCFVGKNEKIIHANDYDSGYAFDINSKNNQTNIINKLKIPQVTIDSFCEKNKINKINAIKIDVDGIDMEVLQGAKKIITKHRPSIMIEHYSQNLINFFSSLNYDLYTFSSTKKKSYHLKLEKILSYEDDKWIKMICCIPKDNTKKYEEKKFLGNIFFGINRNAIIKYFNLSF